MKRRSAVDRRAAMLHDLLDTALAGGVQPIELESSIGQLLNLARRRGQRDAPHGRGEPQNPQ
ncbi:MAG TPA: hypothetical protein VGG41_19535 [Solirubrobacteraceae bacterium]